jgi:predicted kinase
VGRGVVVEVSVVMPHFPKALDNPKKEELHCSFCGKSRKEVHRLVQSAKGPIICDECLVVSFALMIESPVKFQEPSTPVSLQDDAGLEEQMEEKTLLMLVGLPRSGKSTWARAEKLPIVCPDAIRLALHGQAFASQAEPHVWAIARTMVRALFLAGHETVILDACNNTKKRRDEWRSKGWRRVFRIMRTSEGVCHNRAVNERPDLVPVIARMADTHEPVIGAELDDLKGETTVDIEIVE